MQALQIRRYGGKDVLELNQNAPKPIAGNEQVLVEVRAASANPVDWKLRAGYLKDMAPLTMPATLGGDFAGIVAAVGPGTSEFKVGDRVYGYASLLSGGSGSFAEAVAAKLSTLAPAPRNTSFVEAAALPLVGASAVQALERHIKLQRGQKILIHGGGGVIGSIAIQIAKSIGAHVATTAKADDRAYVQAMGAAEVIDYTKEPFEQRLKDFDGCLTQSAARPRRTLSRYCEEAAHLCPCLASPMRILPNSMGSPLSASGRMSRRTC